MTDALYMGSMSRASVTDALYMGAMSMPEAALG
jgi:hypothetical protein